jgi:ABC-type dipeptide/oligopeptide/nickel transport system permease component
MRYWFDRAIETLPLLIGISLIAFTMFRLSPRDPTMLVLDPTMASAEDRAAVRREMGLDDPFFIQYGKMMRSMVTGELKSFKSKQSTLTIVREAFPTSALVGGLGIAGSVLLAIVCGTLAGRNPGGWIDRLVSGSMVLSIAAPSFLIGLLLIRLFTEEWHLLPGSGLAPPGTVGFAPQPKYLILPVFAVAFGIAPILARYLRDALVTVLADDYVRTARAKGVAERGVLYRHALRNALIPVVSLLNTFIPVTLGGLVIVESVFGLPGLGRVTTSAALSADYPVVLTNVLFVAVLTLGASLIVDAVYGVIDPRIRLT